MNGNRAKPIRDYVLESESVKILEDTLVDHLTETILSKLASQMKTGVPTMGIPPLDPLRLKPIKVEPNIGNDVFTIYLNDIEIHGLSNLDLQDIRPKLNALKVRIALLFPKLTAKCHFSVNGTMYNVIEVDGEGSGELEYNDVLLRTQLNLLHENNTFQIGSSDPPLVDFSNARIKLSRDDYFNNTSETGIASELGPLLFWVLADHVVQEVDDYLLKYVNNNLLLFKVSKISTQIKTLINLILLTGSRILHTNRNMVFEPKRKPQHPHTVPNGSIQSIAVSESLVQLLIKSSTTCQRQYKII